MWKCQRVLYLLLTGPREFRHWARPGLAACFLAAAAGAAVPGTAPGDAAGPAAPETARTGRRIAVRVELFTRVRAFGFALPNRHPRTHIIHRTRVDLFLQPLSRLSLHLRGEDARGFVSAGPAPRSNVGELSLVEADLRLGRNWTLRGGRQELSFGDERLVGGDTEWCQIGQRFDAIRLRWQRPRLRFDAFASSPVAVRRRGWDRPTSGVSFHGLHVSWAGSGSRTGTDAYLFWKAWRSGGLPGHRFTAGFRHVHRIAHRWETVAELAGQWGTEAGRPVRAWAGHCEAGLSLLAPAELPHLSLEYNLATGDDPRTGAVERFDDLYPAGHDRFGLPDPVPWSDMQTLGVAAEWPAPRRWSFTTGVRSIWQGPGMGLRHLGWQVSGMAGWSLTPGWLIVCSYSRLAARAAAYYGGPINSFSGGVKLRFGGR